MNKRMSRRRLIQLNKKPLNLWNAEEFTSASVFIRRAVLRNLKRELNIIPIPIVESRAINKMKKFILTMATVFYRSGETIDFLVSLKCFEPWMFAKENMQVGKRKG